MLKVVLDNEAQGDPLEELMEQHIPTTFVHNNIRVEIAPGGFMNINANLNEKQQQKLIQILSKYQQDFSWEYPDMKGIDPQLCTHHIYIEKDAQTHPTAPTKIKPSYQGHCQRRVTKTIGCRYYIPYFRQLVGLSTTNHPYEEWEVENLCRIKRNQ
jgi:hypothetical protein